MLRIGAAFRANTRDELWRRLPDGLWTHSSQRGGKRRACLKRSRPARDEKSRDNRQERDPRDDAPHCATPTILESCRLLLFGRSPEGLLHNRDSSAYMNPCCGPFARLASTIAIASQETRSDFTSGGLPGANPAGRTVFLYSEY